MNTNIFFLFFCFLKLNKPPKGGLQKEYISLGVPYCWQVALQQSLLPLRAAMANVNEIINTRKSEQNMIVEKFLNFCLHNWG